MSKKLIAVMTVATILFVCIFAACEKDEDNIYIDDKEYEFVTDENGERVLADDGRLLVYETDEHGRIVKDENGEPVTYAKQFQPIQNDNVVEDFGFKLTLPDGWKSTAEYNSFINPDKDYKCDVTVVKYFYEDYYATNKQVYDTLVENNMDVTWEENVEFSEDYSGICRMVLSTEDGTSVMYFFENADNVYKLLFTGSGDTLVEDTEEFCKAMDFKPFAYYDDITEKAVTTKASVSETTEAE